MFTHRCVMCGAYRNWVYGTINLCLDDPRCRKYGLTSVPWGSAAIFKFPDEEKEQDMCNNVKRWGVVIEPGSRTSDGSDTYYVRFDHKDRTTTDQLSRNFDTFEQALDFANKTYKELK
jgi:hypothetical protein